MMRNNTMNKILTAGVIGVCAFGALPAAQPVFAAETDEAVKEAVREGAGRTLQQQAKESMPITSELLKQGTPVATEDGAGQLIQVTAKVVATNEYARMVKLQGPEGKAKWYKVSDKLYDVSAIKPNDLVKVSYYETVVVDLVKGGVIAPDARAMQIGDVKDEIGEKPAADYARGVKLSGTIEAVDAKNSMVTVRGPETTRTIRVQDPALLEGVSVGDTITAIYFEALAVSVEPAK
jgi:hypothetical protein